MNRIYARPVSAVVVVLVGLSLCPGPFDGGFGLVRPAMATLPDDSPGATVTTTVEPACDVLGLQFTVQVCNDTTTTMYDVVISETLPIGLTYSVGSLTSTVPASMCEEPSAQTIAICLTDPLLPGECVTITFVATFAEALCNHVVVTATGPTGEIDQGCTPGYWKNHASEWPTGDDEQPLYAPGDDFDTTFGVNLFDPDLSLADALNQGGGGVNALGRHAVAALLSAAHPDVNYPLDVGGVLAAVGAGNKDLLEGYNELGCPIGEDSQSVQGSDDVCLDPFLGNMVGCLCGGGDPCPDPCDVAAYCELGPEEECDPFAVYDCILSFYDFTDTLIWAFQDERCQDCCPGYPPDCGCLSPS